MLHCMQIGVLLFCLLNNKKNKLLLQLFIPWKSKFIPTPVILARQLDLHVNVDKVIMKYVKIILNLVIVCIQVCTVFFFFLSQL